MIYLEWVCVFNNHKHLESKECKGTSVFIQYERAFLNVNLSAVMRIFGAYLIVTLLLNIQYCIFGACIIQKSIHNHFPLLTILPH